MTDAIGRRRPYHRNPGTSQALPDGKDDCQGHQHGRENDDGKRCPVRGLARGHRFPVRRSIATLRRRYLHLMLRARDAGIGGYQFVVRHVAELGTPSRRIAATPCRHCPVLRWCSLSLARIASIT